MIQYTKGTQVGAVSARLPLLGLICGVALTGCSSLQIDVDVYKGALVNEKEIQLKQFAASAMSAHPLILHMKESAEAQKCAKPYTLENEATCGTKDFLIKFLTQIADLYKDSGQRVEKELALQPVKGLETLTKALNDALKYGEIGPDQREKNIERAREELTNALIIFSQKILFTANNQALYKELSSSDMSGVLKDEVALLQSLGNTILVHANDLQRQETRLDHFKESGPSESAAITRAFNVAPSTAFDQIVSAMESAQIPIKQVSTQADTAAAQQASAKERDQLKIAEAAQAALKASADNYRNGISSLLAAYRTVVDDLPSELDSDATGNADRAAMGIDRKTISALYGSQALADTEKTYDEAIKPLRAWLDIETSLTTPLITQRQARLTGLVQYLTSYKSMLAASVPGQATKRSDVLENLKTSIRTALSLAKEQINEDQERQTARKQEINQLNQIIADLEKKYTAKVKSESDANLSQSGRASVVGVLKYIRQDVMIQAEAAKVTEALSVQNLINVKLAALSATSSNSSTPTKADVELTKASMAQLTIPPNAASCVGIKDGSDTTTCMTRNPIEWVDYLIATLRAQRIRALASGEKTKAADLQNAINAAYDQRSSMVYLRPASDYLRSVYSANTFQDRSDESKKNKLLDWLNYINPRDSDPDHGKRQLEKLNWQNINKVTVAGGGSTNYVLAKDDVGNWYVKSYSANPESIIKAATSLALFNSGKAYNVNMLRRLELQRQVDDPKTSTQQRKQLQDELKESNSQDGGALLKVKQRYAARYRSDTERQATSLRESLIAMQSTLDTALSKVTPPAASCNLNDVKAGLVPLDNGYLDAARSNLGTLLLTKPLSNVATEDLEKAIQSGMTSIYLYSGQVYGLLSAPMPADCDSWPRNAAERSRSVLRGVLITLATDRKKSIDHYEEALSSIADIATEK
ncbi:hypothetical protein Jab_1c13090 [Janthinobacterium sp. HH01]|uniref:hypothetical protein n=1 Tax=Janthinobacterium sp. HH01 TaxID=1198452 RepID=UPI0002AEBD39|nr:hypothetical protein [Janthinobacterium sp. HH01]ELX12694.1 hypothetical protein Jab_1c13090 [Janthinobacterium sp. HH01]